MTKKMVTLDEWYVEFSKQATSEVVRLIDEEKRELGDWTEAKFQQHFLAAFIGRVVFSSLADVSDKTKKETKQVQFKKTTESFQNMKTLIQDAVAAGFQGAMRTYSGQEIEYYCQVRTVPQAVNKEPC